MCSLFSSSFSLEEEEEASNGGEGLDVSIKGSTSVANEGVFLEADVGTIDETSGFKFGLLLTDLDDIHQHRLDADREGRTSALLDVPARRPARSFLLPRIRQDDKKRSSIWFVYKVSSEEWRRLDRIETACQNLGCPRRSSRSLTKGKCGRFQFKSRRWM
ncbi:hypothetical protein BT69DRAFT_492631 [Atractiella rhizophila]|nr:hypothetical protein BT69DRAFT_492631 [Atractiella rhizophila]